MALQPGTNKQIPDHAIMDFYNKQNYLGNAFIYCNPSVEITSTSEYPLLLLSNPAVSATAFPSGYQSLFVNLKKGTCLTANESAIFRYYLNPTGTAGTAQTAINLRPLSTASSIAALSLSPTISANGSPLESMACLAFETVSSSLMAILDPGQSLLVTVQAASTSTYVSPVLGWYPL